MTTFVLIHGAFRGGWAWQRMRPLLLEGGHDLYTPSLLGCGELASYADRVSGLAVWVDQVVDLLESHDLNDVVLGAHSQGGVIAAAVAAAVPDRLREVAYLDAAVPVPGERAVDLTPSTHELPPRETLIPARPLEPGGDLDPETAAWASARLTPTPFAPSLDPMPAPDSSAQVPARFAFCTDTPQGYPCHATRSRLEASGTSYDWIDAGHDAALTAPKAVAAWLTKQPEGHR